MLSSKLKSWVESHLTRKKSSAGNKKSSHSYHHHHHNGGGGGGGVGGGGSSGSSHSSSSHGTGCKELSSADRIAHPASSLVNLVPAVPLCSSSGRSNAGLVIRLQNDFAAAASVSSPCHRSHHPSWSRSPVMLAWNSKIPVSSAISSASSAAPAPASPHPKPTLPPLDPPISPPPSLSSSTTIHQVRLPRFYRFLLLVVVVVALVLLYNSSVW